MCQENEFEAVFVLVVLMWDWSHGLDRSSFKRL